MKKPYKYRSNILLGSALLGQTSAFAVTLKRVFSICIQYLSNISQLSTQEKVANLHAVWDRIPWGIIQKMCQFIWILMTNLKGDFLENLLKNLQSVHLIFFTCSKENHMIILHPIQKFYKKKSLSKAHITSQCYCNFYITDTIPLTRQQILNDFLFIWGDVKYTFSR